MKNARIAVLMATYNGQRWLKEQLASIVQQDCSNISLYVSDDCSNDKTLEIVHSFSEILNIKIFFNENRLGSAASNFFSLLNRVDCSNFDYLFFSDQDDIWLSNKISKAIELMESTQSHGYASNLICFYEDGRKIELVKNWPQTKSDFLFQSASAGCTYGITSALAGCVKGALRGAPPSTFSKMSHDWLIYAISRSHSYKWVIDRNAYILYRQHANNAWGALGIKSYVKRLKLLKSGWYRKNIADTASFCLINSTNDEILWRLKRWRWRDRLTLAMRANGFRRRPIEKLAIAILIIIGYL